MTNKKNIKSFIDALGDFNPVDELINMYYSTKDKKLKVLIATELLNYLRFK